jgi:hypothetical protein
MFPIPMTLQLPIPILRFSAWTVMMVAGLELLISPMSLTIELMIQPGLFLTSGTTMIISPAADAEDVTLVEEVLPLNASSTAITRMPKWVEQEILTRMPLVLTAMTHMVLLAQTQVEFREERC